MKYTRSFALLATLALAPFPFIRAQVATEVVYVTIEPTANPSSTQSSLGVATTSSATSIRTSTTSIATPSTFATMTSSASSSIGLSSTETQSVQAASTTSSSGSGSDDSGAPSSGTAVDTDAGASGHSGGTHLSNGAIAAICVVIALVVIIGIASTVLYIIAKRRQWNIRASIRRASRRLTGRSGQPKTPRTATADRQSRRAGVRLQSPPRPDVKAVYPPSHKRGLVAGARDTEKGPQPLDGKAPANTRPRENTWIQRLWGNDWK